MEYVTPISCDQTDPERPYTDTCASMGVRGSETPARFYNLILAEGRNLVEGAGLTLDPDNDAQWLDAVCELIAQKMQAAGSGSSDVPTGLIAPFGAETPPSGWLECDGSAVDRTTYADLFAVVGSTYGPGDGSMTFNLPDLRGEFLRGWDNGRGLDGARTFASVQDHAIENITGTFTDFNPRGTNPTGAFFETGTGDPSQGNNPCGPNQQVIGFDASRVVNAAAETRPHNVALLYCIKA